MRRASAIVFLVILINPVAAFPEEILPSIATTIEDGNCDGTGDTFFSLPPNRPFVMKVCPSVREMRAIHEFDLSANTGDFVLDAVVFGRILVNNSLDVGLRTFVFQLFAGNGSAELTDFETPGIDIGVGSYSPPSEQWLPFSFSIKNEIQQLLDDGVEFVGFRVVATSNPNAPNYVWEAALTIEAADSAAGRVLNAVDVGFDNAFSITTSPTGLVYTGLTTGTALIYDLDLNLVGFVDGPASFVAGLAYVDRLSSIADELFWLDGRNEVLYQTSLNGLFLNSFPVTSPFPSGDLKGLTWSPASNTLWTTDAVNDIYFEVTLTGSHTGRLFAGQADVVGFGITRVGHGLCFDIVQGLSEVGPVPVRRVLQNGVIQDEVTIDTPADRMIRGIAWHPTGSTGREVDYVVGQLARGEPATIFEVDMGLFCPAVFTDGFESGDTFAWSSTVP